MRMTEFVFWNLVMAAILVIMLSQVAVEVSGGLDKLTAALSPYVPR